MKIDVRPRKRNAPRPAEKSAPRFLQWLRGRQCACRGNCSYCGGKMEAAHVDYAGGKGVGTKVADKFAIPLTAGCHRLQHAIGWRAFDQRYLGGTNGGLNVAAAYWRAWPGRAAWEAKQDG